MTNDSELGARSCQEFQQRLQVLSAAGEDLYRDPHLQICASCRSLVV